MAVPSRPQQIEAVMKFIDSERNEGRPLKEVAADIVDGYHELLMHGIKKPATPLRVGMLLKSPLNSKVRRVSWMDDGRGRVWIVQEESSYGWLGPLSAPVWDHCEEYSPKRRVEIDGKGKMLEMTDDEITEVWGNPDWKVGDRVSQHQREHVYEVIATGPKCVLMQHAITGVLLADDNKSLEKYYRKR